VFLFFIFIVFAFRLGKIKDQQADLIDCPTKIGKLRLVMATGDEYEKKV
jgi:hypothetical protein